VSGLLAATRNATDVGSHLISRSERRVPTSAREIFEALADMGALDRPLAAKLADATAFRNLAIHRYDTIDWNVVYRICHESLVDLRTFADRVERWMAD